LIEDGKLRALAVMSKTRLQARPEVPTMAEAGYPGIGAMNWFGILVPAGTPNEITTLLNREIVEIIVLPSTKEHLVTLGDDPVGSSPEEFANVIKADVEKWGKVIRVANIKL
jgi:tripartite-type tricarboxylate transporter receptor subunit TctC